MKLLETRVPVVRPSIPSGFETTPHRWWDFLWIPGVTALVTLLVGSIGYAAQAVWLFPSLGPTVALQILSPHRESARPYHVIAGHLCGLAAGLLAVFLTGAQAAAPAVLGAPMALPHVWACTIAMALTVVFQQLLRARHAPAYATALLVALGAFPADQGTAETIIVGVLLVVAFGEPARSAALSRAAHRVIGTRRLGPPSSPSVPDRR
jgi:hypothetical protein